MESVKEAFESFLEVAIEETKELGSSKLAGFLLLKHKTAASARPGRWKNPRTGCISQLAPRPAKKTVTIHPMPKFKKLMNMPVVMNLVEQ